MKRTLVVDERARAEMERISAWWAQNRRSAPNAFDEELARALRAIVEWPDAHPRAPHVLLAATRRALLRTSRCFVYFVLETVDDGERVRVLAIRHARRMPKRI